MVVLDEGGITQRLPRSWIARIVSSAAFAQLKRDASVLRRRAAGYGPPPLVRRSPVSRTGTAKARELTVARVVAETKAAVTLVLRDERHADAVFDFRPGQFFTVLTEVDGEIVPRNYSASNAPGDAELHLTIKIKEGGRISPLLARVEAGGRLRVLGPFGSFVVHDPPDLPPYTPDAPPETPDARPRVLVLVAGGAGITPLASIARTLLAREATAQIALVYANRDANDVIFASALDALAREHAPRFTVVHVTGLLDRDTATTTLDALPHASHPAARFFVCGPDGMRDEVLGALGARGVAEGAIAIERFTIGPRPQVAASPASFAVAPGARPVAIRIDGRTHRTTALPGATVLEAGLAAGAPMPFSCAVGGCGACKLRVVEGSVEVEEPNCLTAAERGAGFVLACVGRPCGPCVLERVEETATRGGA